MHRRESIMQAVETVLTGLTTTGANIVRLRAWPLDNLPALSINQGADQPDSADEDMDAINRTLFVEVKINAAASDDLETVLNQISTEVYAAMVADRTLGLAYVFDVFLSAESAPGIEGAQNQSTAILTMEFSVRYEHAAISTEV